MTNFLLNNGGTTIHSDKVNTSINSFLNNFGGSLPLFLKVPAEFLNYIWKDTSYGYKGNLVPTPEIDKVLSNFIDEYRPILFTYEFIQYVNRQTFLFNQSAIDAKIDFAVSSYRKICNVPNSTDEELEKILWFYFGNGSSLVFGIQTDFVFGSSTNLQKLAQLMVSTENKYVLLQKNTINKSNQEEFKITEPRAKELVSLVKTKITHYKNEFFASNMNGCQIQSENAGEMKLTEKGQQAKELLSNPKVLAFLIVVRNAEAYGRVVAGGQLLQHDEAFGFKKLPNYSDHPRTLPGNSSSAAGAYQIMTATWFGKGKDKGAKKLLGLTDFSPTSQDIFAASKLRDKGVIGPLLADDFAGAVQAASSEWASFPDKTKGDPETNPTSRFSGQAHKTPSLSWLKNKYDNALGK